MSKCRVCGSHVELGDCAVCGFPVFSISGGEAEAQIRDAASLYRKERWYNPEILVEVFYNKADGDYVKTDHSEWLSLGVSDELRQIGTVWLPTEFARPDDSVNSIELTVKLRDGVRKLEKTIKCKVKNVKKPQLLRIGIKKQTNMSYVIMVGRPDDFEQSAPFAINAWQ